VFDTHLLPTRWYGDARTMLYTIPVYRTAFLKKKLQVRNNGRSKIKNYFYFRKVHVVGLCCIIMVVIVISAVMSLPFLSVSDSNAI
jgi:hypothetical protein